MKKLSREELFTLIGIIESKIPPKIIIPNENETVVISDCPKTAALCYDRVWCPTIDIFTYTGKMPDEIRFFGGTTEERLLSFQGPILVQVEKNILDECCFPTLDRLKRDKDFKHIFEKSTLSFLSALHNAKSENDSRKILEDSLEIPLDQREQYLKNTKFIEGCFYRDIALAFSKKYKKGVSTIFSSDELQKTIYYEGDKSIIFTTMENLQIVDEEKITWDQVIELRRDKESREKYRRFLHWLDKEMIGKSQSFIEDEIAQRLEDYKSALKKQGIKTVIGTIEEILSGDILKPAIASGIIAITTDPLLGILAGTGLFISNVAVKLAKKKIEYDEVEKGPNSEISWVYEVKERVGK